MICDTIKLKRQPLKGDNHMERKVISVKYSVFGRYDYIEAIPETISKLFQKFASDEFMPNVINLLKIQQPQNTVQQILRPQLINSKMTCTISLLPERVDIEFSGNSYSYNEKAIEYYKRLVELFDLKINRIALNTSTMLVDLSEDEIVQLNSKLTPPENYCNEQNLVEYSSRRISRKYLDAINENINIGRNITSIAQLIERNQVIGQIQIDTDINTLGELTQERFNINDCQAFFDLAMKTDNDVVSNIEEIVNVK